jgi:hypothetical protein
MKPLVTNVLVATVFVVSAVCLSTWAATGGKNIAIGPGNDEPAVLKADQTLQSAIRGKDEKTIGALLDEQFTWTNGAGQTRGSAQFLRDVKAGNDTEYTNMKARDFGQLAIVTGLGVHGGKADTIFVRVWVKRPAGWRLLAHQGTSIVAGGTPAQQSPATGSVAVGESDCENPCRSIPFTPKTAEQKEVAKAYQDVETAVSTHDAKTWGYHVADEFVGIGRRYTGKPDTKQERMAQIKTGSGPVVLPKMTSLQMFVFGDAATMIADHQASGERPFHVIRVWVNRDGRWQLLHRQETSIAQPAGATP